MSIVDKLLKTSGFDQLIEDMTKLNKEQAKQLKAMVKAESKPILEESRRLAPVSATGSHGKASGELKNSLEVQFERARKQGKRVIFVGFKEGMALDQNRKPYGQFVEYGRKGKTGTVAARPFLKPSMEGNYDSTRGKIEDSILKIFDATMKEKK